MKRYPWPFTIAVLIGLILGGSGAAIGFGMQHDNNSPPGFVRPADVTLGQATRGIVFSDAAINPDGTVAACFSCTASTHLSTGVYQVTFIHNVQANNGWSRWVQVDTLTTGSFSGVVCDTADRAGVPDAIFVDCMNSAGAFQDASFFLFIAR
jgi:hypothetical protein